MGLGSETRDAQVACMLVKHILGVDAVQRDVVARDAEGDELRLKRQIDN